LLSAAAGPDGQILLAHVLGCSRAAVLAGAQAPLEPAQRAVYDELLRRRSRGEPVAYLTGHKEFWSLDLVVTPDVLIPRPETELLVEWALLLAPFSKGGRREAAGGFRVLDLGTGSGAIALALASERPASRVTATDVSDRTLDVARGNAARLGIANVDFLQSDMFEKLDCRLRGNDGFDLILSNPPYVAEGDPHLQDLQFEPAAALTSGADGLDALRTIVGGARNCLESGGWLLTEHGATQGAAVRALFEQAGFGAVETRRDLAGHERATGGRAP
jgi:release factor glutamine methyltransferase